MDPIQTIEVSHAVDCDVCGDPAEEMPPCGHGYCWGCLNQLIRTACEDGERWPPSCCSWLVNIDSPDIKERLLPDVVQAVERSRQYYATRNKLFCCDRDCRRYIAPDQVDEYTNIGFCKACWGGTCSLCRRHPHIGKCKGDFQKKAMEKYLIYKGWKRCEMCGSIVEKSTGCNHMTCTCGEEFCYLCGQHWRNCDCPQDGDHEHNNDLAVAASPWFRFPKQPRCYGRGFLANTCLPQTFFCAKCEHRCGGSGESSYQCQDCGRHLCKRCMACCIDDGRYHNPDWNAVSAEARDFVEEDERAEEPSATSTTAQLNPERN